jgi:hypothetical protein
MMWRTACITLLDDIIDVLAKPNLKAWKGKVTLVLTQAFTITFTCWMLLRWNRNLIMAHQLSAYQDNPGYQAAIATLYGQQESVEGDIENDGDRFLV